MSGEGGHCAGGGGRVLAGLGAGARVHQVPADGHAAAGAAPCRGGARRHVRPGGGAGARGAAAAALPRHPAGRRAGHPGVALQPPRAGLGGAPPGAGHTVTLNTALSVSHCPLQLQHPGRQPGRGPVGRGGRVVDQAAELRLALVCKHDGGGRGSLPGHRQHATAVPGEDNLIAS